MGRALYASAGLLLLAACGRDSASAACQSASECGYGQLCIAGRCRAACQLDADCPASECCDEVVAACTPDPGACNPCEASRCGMGRCSVDANGAASCACPEGFHAEGLTCVLTCGGIDCSRHGTCVADSGAALCSCDAGYDVAHDSAGAVSDPTVCLAICGDGIVEEGETCDDGINDASYDHCQPGCQGEPTTRCGDGVVNGPEACDDGNTLDNDFCAGDCLSPGPMVHVFVLAGQSNMDGYGVSGELYPLLWPRSDVRLFWVGHRGLGPLLPAASVAGKFGPELGFAQRIVAGFPGELVVLVKHAVGGTNLHTDWSPGVTADSPRGAEYRTLVAGLTEALGELALGGEFPILTGVLWMQGEADGTTLAGAQAYLANLVQLIARLREDLHSPALPFVLGRINAPDVLYRADIRDTQSLVDAVVANTALVDTDDLVLLPDNIHYGTAGQVTLGHRFADALLALAPEPPAPAAGSLDFLSWRVPESRGFSLLYELPIENRTDYNTAADVDVDLSVDNHLALAAAPFDRVAYLLVLKNAAEGRRYAWASMDPFSADVTRLGLPAGRTVQRTVAHLDAYSDSPGVTPTIASTSGNIELWGSSYTPGAGLGLAGASSVTHDFDDTPLAGEGYGSFQVHNAGHTVMAFNHWGSSIVSSFDNDLGLGDQPSGEPDWTFAYNAATYSEKVLRVFVQPATPPALIADAAGYTRVYSLEIPTDANWDTAQDVPYTLDRSVELAGRAFDRVGYYLELLDATGLRYVWVSVDAFTTNLAQTGVPVDWTFDKALGNMTIDSNDPRVTPVTTATGGSMEFWSHCYAPGTDGIANAADVMTAVDCYGSMQLHRDGKTVLAFNRWSSGVSMDVGIGEQPGAPGTAGSPVNPDWTYAMNGAHYLARRLQVYLRLTP